MGCEQARKILDQEGVEGIIECADFFSPPEHMLGAYDFVVSFGVIEHFDDTQNSIRALSRFLKDGGFMITLVPNMTGSIGWVQKHINRPVYDIHKLITREDLIDSSREAGRDVVECEYYLSTNFGVCNLNGLTVGDLSWVFKKVVLSLLGAISVFIAYLGDSFFKIPSVKMFSPYVFCLSRKRQQEIGISELMVD